MFWKKKDKPPQDSWAISFEVDRRHYYRVKPDPKQPAWVKVQDKTFQVADISAGGAAVRGASFTTGRRVPGLLILPDGLGPMELGLQVVACLPDKGLCTVQFIDLGEGDRERLHQYVLDRQKIELEQRRREERELAAKRNPPKS